MLTRNQFIFLEKKKKEGKDEFCIAQANETMHDIAQKNGICYKVSMIIIIFHLVTLLQWNKNILKASNGEGPIQSAKGLTQKIRKLKINYG